MKKNAPFYAGQKSIVFRKSNDRKLVDVKLKATG